MRPLFYKPYGAWAADFIPFYKDGLFHLFYLQDWRDPAQHGEGTPWYQITTPDFRHFTERGEMLARGTREEQDLYVFTGSVIEADGRFHIFYTGHNPHFRSKGRPEQAVMHAVSDDLYHWTKLPHDTFYAPDTLYEPHDWRDPFVFWNEETGEYAMLLAARRQTGPSRRRGCLALCTSRDLMTWQVEEPFWAPDLYFTHECPDLFRMGEWWYLVYSTFSERQVTHYRMSRLLSGPWQAPENDAFDGRAYYAAKTASDGTRRFLFGWNATREQEQDDRPWQWGGSLVVHEIVQEADGSLSVRLPDSVAEGVAVPQPCAWTPEKHAALSGSDSVEITAPDSFGYAMAGAMPSCCRLEATVVFRPGTRGCGLVLRADATREAGYYIRLEPGRQRLVLDSWPRPGDVPFMVELERPLALRAGEPINLTVLVEDSVCEVYAAGSVAMSARLYNHKVGDWGVFVNEGVAGFENLRLTVPSPPS